MSLTDFQNFFESTLSAPINATDLVISLPVAPVPTEGWLLLDYDVPSKREFVYYTSRTATTVTLASVAKRGMDGTTAIAHTQNAKVRMNVNAGLLKDISALSATIVNSNNNGGWVANPGNAVPNSVTYNGQRSYNMVFNSVDLTGTYSPGTRARTTRTVAAPTQCTSLNGTTQYWVKTSPNKLTFTDDFVVSAWVKLASYPSGSVTIVSRFNGTSGWQLQMTASGQLYLSGYNAGGANRSEVNSYQSLPLNRWVHITAQLDMSTAGTSATTSYIMFDGVDIPATKTTNGTNPTALIQAGNLEIGSAAGGAQFFPGKIAQVAIFNAKVTQATMLTYISQGLAGTETSLASAYSFNGVTTDLNTTTPNDLSAGAGSPTATNADSPFGTQASGLISSTLDYAIVQSATFSTNTTLVVQVPEGCTIPTSGGVSAVAYSGQGAPYGFPKDIGKWSMRLILFSQATASGTTISTVYNPGGLKIIAPIGTWNVLSDLSAGATTSGALQDTTIGVSTSASIFNIPELSSRLRVASPVSSTDGIIQASKNHTLSFTSPTSLYVVLLTLGVVGSLYVYGNNGASTYSSSSITLVNGNL